MVHLYGPPAEMERDSRWLCLWNGKVCQAADPLLPLVVPELRDGDPSSPFDDRKWQKNLVQFTPRKDQIVVINRYPGDAATQTLDGFAAGAKARYGLDESSFAETELARRGIPTRPADPQPASLDVEGVMDHCHRGVHDHWYTGDTIWPWSVEVPRRIDGWRDEMVTFAGKQRRRRRPIVGRPEISFGFESVDAAAFRREVIDKLDGPDTTKERPDVVGAAAELGAWMDAHDGETMFAAVFGFAAFDDGVVLRKNGNEMVFAGRHGDDFWLVVYGG